MEQMTCITKKLTSPKRKNSLPAKSKNTSPSHANTSAIKNTQNDLDFGETLAKYKIKNGMIKDLVKCRYGSSNQTLIRSLIDTKRNRKKNNREIKFVF